MKKILLFVVVIIIGGVIINDMKSNVKYVEFDCPRCESSEVLDFGTDLEGNQKCHCYDCELDFTIIK